ncbi:MAG: beta-lactamase family protein, partial [Polaromonas sp.]|nr:beta-lactamase family protein [Polaromonas sp.]
MNETNFAPAAEVGLCPDRLQRLVKVLHAEVASGRLPGAVALVARRGKVALFESLGMQNPDAGIPMARESIFRIYSMTKPVVSVAAMMLMEQGRLLLADPVARYLPEYAHQKVASERNGQLTLHPVERDATVHDLLRHTAGLSYEFLGSAEVQRQYTALQMGSRERSNAEFSRVLAAIPLMHQPGSIWEYSRATDVLGRLVEAVSGQTLDDHLQR